MSSSKTNKQNKRKEKMKKIHFMDAVLKNYRETFIPLMEELARLYEMDEEQVGDFFGEEDFFPEFKDALENFLFLEYSD